VQYNQNKMEGKQMTKPRYQKVISLNEKDAALVSELNKQGVKTVDIFRAGLFVWKKEVAGKIEN